MPDKKSPTQRSNLTSDKKSPKSRSNLMSGDKVHQPGLEHNADVDLFGPDPRDPLGSPVAVTLFNNRTGTRIVDRTPHSLRDLARRIGDLRSCSKDGMGHIKLGAFGNRKSRNGSYRHNGNHLSVSGIEADYDAGEVSAEEAAETLTSAGVAAMIYTTPSNGQPGKGHRWRVLCPFARERSPAERRRHVAVLNGALGGILAAESFKAAQGFAFGQVRSGPRVAVELVEGRFLDEVDDIAPIDPRGETTPAAAPETAEDLSWDAGRVARAQAMLRGASERLGETEAERNDACCREAFHMGGLVANDLLTVEEVLEALGDAMAQNGYLDDHAAGDTAEVERIVRAQIEAGARRPVDPGRDPISMLDDLPDDLPANTVETAPKVARRKDGSPINSLHNAIVFLGRINDRKRLGIRFNEFTQRDEWKDGEQITDVEENLIRVHLEVGGMPTVPSDLVSRAITSVARRNAYHPVRDWLNSLEHDGRPRLSTWLCDHLGAQPSPYVEAVSRATLIGLVARVMEPGCKHDHVLVLTGPQGAGKSTACAVLGGRWFSDNMPAIHTDDKEAARWLPGKWLIELSELAPTRKSEAEALKSFLSRAVDMVRRPYDRREREVPRECAFIATTNDPAFIRDTTGGRRFWPVEVGRIDGVESTGPDRRGGIDGAESTGRNRQGGIDGAESLRRNRDQLFAEAVAAYRAGEPWHLSPEMEALARVEQDEATEEDPWEERVRDWLDHDFDGEPRDEVSIPQVLEQALHVEAARAKMAEGQRVSRILVKLGWKKVTIRGRRVWRRA